ncbi:MAG: aspartate aminotransferase family protein [Gammaproteobacteria bacterium]|nr:aspartate aminotransferase family protein [Gammaproteobacteria bacterium]
MTTPLSPASESLIATGRRCYVPNYQPREVILERGQGSRIWDADGNEYIDLGCGISVNSLGHQHPALVAALREQSGKLWHTSNIYFNEPAVRLAETLVDSTFAQRVYFCNSGAEANEAAIKLARKFASARGVPAEKRTILTFTGSFHGRTMATVTATAQPKYHSGFEPLPPGFRYCPFNDLDALDEHLTSDTCAVLVEPIQGEGGVMPAADGFLAELRRRCDALGALLILDEIQCGMGRTGKLFAYEWEKHLVPDIVTMAKALGGGLPLGATLVGEKAADTMQFGSHGSTFGGNPVMCAVARAAFHEINDSGLLDDVIRQGNTLQARLERTATEIGVIERVRGRGLMLGATLLPNWRGKAGDIVERCRHHGVLILQAGPDVLRFLPPLNINDQDLQHGLDRVEQALRELM